MDSDLPRSLELLWGRADRRRRPAQALSLERIVAAAIELADAEGLPALSMARLAERLGSATMSLYRHVSSKEELQVFMMDAAPGEPPAVDVDDGWRRGMQRWAGALQAVYYRHAWILQITAGRPPLEPGQLGWLDAALRTLAGTRLSSEEKLSIVLLILNYVRGEAQIGTAMLRTSGDGDPTWYGRMLARLVDRDRFPALATLVDTGTFDQVDDGTSDFDFGLARILDGVEAFIER